MNKLMKVIIAFMGATNVMFTIFVPVAIALLFINFAGVTGWRADTLVVAGMISTLYRAIDIGFIKD